MNFDIEEKRNLMGQDLAKFLIVKVSSFNTYPKPIDLVLDYFA